MEPYLQFTQKQHQARAADLAKLRMSAHRLQVEVGRYQGKPLERRICPQCTTCDSQIIDCFFELPFMELQVETEQHFLQDCPAYDDIRENLPKAAKDLLDDVKAFLQDESNTSQAATYIHKLLKRKEDIRGELDGRRQCS